MEFYVNENASNFFGKLRDYLAEKGCNLFLVEAEYQRPNTDDQATDFNGIDIALKLDSGEAPIILCSVFREKDFISDENLSTKFFALMAKTNTGFIDTINEPEEFYNKYLELINSKKEEDILAVELNRVKEYESVMQRIRHAVFGQIPNHTDSRAIEYINKAREIGVTGTDEEVFKTILDFKWDSKNAKFVGKYFSGIFCDLENTLFIGDGVNLKLLNELEGFSRTKSITLWTAGNIEEYQKKLISKEILWKLVSKRDFFGAEIEIAYDDLPQEKFQAEYGIKVRKFHQVSGSSNEELELKLEFLHSLLIPSGVPDVLINPEFSSILNMTIGSREIRSFVKDMEGEEDLDQYHQTLIILRDFLVN